MYFLISFKKSLKYPLNNKSQFEEKKYVYIHTPICICRDTKLTILTSHEPQLYRIVTAVTLDQDKSLQSNNLIQYNSHRPHGFPRHPYVDTV